MGFFHWASPNGVFVGFAQNQSFGASPGMILLGFAQLVSFMGFARIFGEEVHVHFLGRARPFMGGSLPGVNLLFLFWASPNLFLLWASPAFLGEEVHVHFLGRARPFMGGPLPGVYPLFLFWASPNGVFVGFVQNQSFGLCPWVF
ncbi:hypothetical protein [Pontibacter sp. G13]|uniref:hypothetical protein n=1 Tax=Pontibacter sp. G13 TaxID=3074898 RepID=UPI002889268E|nr:hypothetical protein [Pontibacter sp. G13]WNJ19984.1 hypothetical protein RJD25_05830 [Pontibacter sp. G13]